MVFTSRALLVGLAGTPGIVISVSQSPDRPGAVIVDCTGDSSALFGEAALTLIAPIARELGEALIEMADHCENQA